MNTVFTNSHSSQGESQLYIFKDNEAVIKMIIKGRSPTMRHVSTSCASLVVRQNPPSKIKPEEREIVVDPSASMHMISRKDSNSAELEIVTTSKSPTKVITANGKVQTNEEATVYVKELDLCLTVKLFEDTPAALSLGELCEDHGCSHEWTRDRKPHLIKDGRRIQCNTQNYVPFVVPGLTTGSSPSGLSTLTTRTLSTQEF